MKKSITIALLAIIVGSTWMPLQAQVEHKIDLSKVKEYAEEVYRNTEYISNAHLAVYAKQLEQITIFQEDNPTFQAIELSSVNLMDKYNYFENDDFKNFSPETFNPLKYDLIYYYKKEPVVYYHVDNTNYYIAVSQLKR